jgi:hypothetical protein
VILEKDVHQAEAFANDARVSEKAPYPIGLGVSGNIKIFGMFAEHEISHGSSHDVRLVTGGTQPTGDFDRVRMDVLRANTVLFCGIDECLSYCLAGIISCIANKQKEPRRMMPNYGKRVAARSIGIIEYQQTE